MKKDLNLAVAARLLEYPHDDLAAAAHDAADWLDIASPEAGALARRFADAVATMSPGALEEAYTAAFDFASTGTLYAGEHLFGPSQARASFLARLQVLRRENGIGPSLELPDHLAELLRLAAAMPAGDERDELLRDAVLPTARAALPGLQRGRHPFADALAAVIALVEHVCGAAATEPVAPLARIGPPPGTEPAEHDEQRRGDPDDFFAPSPEAAP